MKRIATALVLAAWTATQVLAAATPARSAKRALKPAAPGLEGVSVSPEKMGLGADCSLRGLKRVGP